MVVVRAGRSRRCPGRSSSAFEALHGCSSAKAGLHGVDYRRKHATLHVEVEAGRGSSVLVSVQAEHELTPGARRKMMPLRREKQKKRQYLLGKETSIMCNSFYR